MPTKQAKKTAKQVDAKFDSYVSRIPVVGTRLTDNVTLAMVGCAFVLGLLIG